MIYPDGTKISWKYDSLLRPVQMNRTAAGRDPLWTQYQYDGQGRLSEKRTSGGYTTRWQYDETGLLGELSHTDASGILDRFQYTYDAAGNKTAINKERRGFPEESGSCQYTYDGLHRLTGVEKDGKPLRSYQYDAFGNRTVMEDYTRSIMTTSKYDALNHLVKQEISKAVFPEDTTGYRYDDISGTYFAQAREYQPDVGRFTAEDVLRGRNTIPKTLNRYGYCWGNPIQYVDVNGRDPITPQDIQKGFWESLLNAADRVVDDFAYQMDCIENDIKDAVNEGYQMVKDGVQTGLDFLGDMVDSGMQMAENGMKAVGDGIQTAVNRAKVGWNDIIDNTIDEIKSYSETIEQTTGIKTMGFSPYSGRTEMGISVGYGTSFVFDSMGNLAWQVNANVGGGFFGAGAGK